MILLKTTNNDFYLIHFILYDQISNIILALDFSICLNFFLIFIPEYRS
jgi:hypothetical protein